MGHLACMQTSTLPYLSYVYLYCLVTVNLGTMVTTEQWPVNCTSSLGSHRTELQDNCSYVMYIMSFWYMWHDWHYRMRISFWMTNFTSSWLTLDQRHTWRKEKSFLHSVVQWSTVHQKSWWEISEFNLLKSVFSSLALISLQVFSLLVSSLIIFSSFIFFYCDTWQQKTQSLVRFWTSGRVLLKSMA